MSKERDERERDGPRESGLSEQGSGSRYDPGEQHLRSMDKAEVSALAAAVKEGPAAALAFIDRAYGGAEGWGRRYVELYDRGSERTRLRLMELEARVRKWVGSEQAPADRPPAIVINLNPPQEPPRRVVDVEGGEDTED